MYGVWSLGFKFLGSGTVEGIYRDHQGILGVSSKDCLGVVGEEAPRSCMTLRTFGGNRDSQG